MEALQPRAEGLPAKQPTPPDFSKKSFAQMFKTEPQQQPLEFPLSVHKGEVAIKISAAAIDKLAVPFKHALVGKFSHGRPTLEETRKSLSKLDFNGALDVGLIDYRHVLLRFHSEADFHRIWTRGIWQIGKYPMRVFKWSPTFQTSKETSIVPVWFELPGLPCHLFDHGVLFSIMKAVGVPITVDAATLNLSRPSVARVNVEIDLMRELPSRIWIEHGDDGEGFWQRIIPEKLPLYCISCFRQGHSHEGCTMNENRMQKLWKPKGPAPAFPNPPSTAADGASKSLMLEFSPGKMDIVAAPNVSSAPRPAGGEMVDLDRDPAEKSGMQNIQMCCTENNSRDAASPSVLSDTIIGEGEMVEAVRDRAILSGKQMVDNEVKGNLSVVDKKLAANKLMVLHDSKIGEGIMLETGRDRANLSGKKKFYTEVEGNSSLAESTLEANKLIQVSVGGSGAGQHEKAAMVAGQQQNAEGVAGAHQVPAMVAGQQQAAIVLGGDLPMIVLNHVPQKEAVVSSGQHINLTETVSGLEIEPRNTEEPVLKQVSNSKFIDWDYVFQTISGNILHNNYEINENLASKILVPQVSMIDSLTSSINYVIDDTILLDGVRNSVTIFDSTNPVTEGAQEINGIDGTNLNDEQIMEFECPSPTFECPHVTNITEGKQMVVGVCATNNCREKGAVLQPILGVEDRNAELQLAWKNLLLSSQNSPGTNATKEFIDSVPRNEELEPGRSIQRGDRYDDLNNAWQNLVSSNAYGEVTELEQMGEAFHSGVAPPEDDKKRKHGMSDRILRSMLSAYNSDPSRASSL